MHFFRTYYMYLGQGGPVPEHDIKNKAIPKSSRNKVCLRKWTRSLLPSNLPKCLCNLTLIDIYLINISA